MFRSLRTTVVGAVLATGSLSPLSAATSEHRPVTIRPDLPLLFADDSGIATRSGVVRTLHPATTHEHPVIQADQSWEGDRVYVYGSAYVDPETGHYRLWYMARPGQEVGGRADILTGPAPLLRNKGFDVTLYATSQDGLNWTKPSLRLYDFNGSSKNNIIFDFHSPSVLRDDTEKDPAKRYKMLGYVTRPLNSYHAAYSADGIHWLSYPKASVLDSSDTITLSHDPVSGEYLAYHKRPAQVRGRARRVVWLSRSSDFQIWSTPELVFVPDEIDDSWVKQPQERTEIYDMSVFPHAAGFIGLPAVFRVMKELPIGKALPGQSPVDGPIDTQLATSADGRTWERSWPRLAMIPRGAPGTFDAGAILGVASTPLNTADQTWVFYTALSTGHGGPLPAKRITIGRADWRLHGFASLDAGPDGGRIETVPLRWTGAELLINADASRGRVRVALQDADEKEIPGFGLEDCVPLQSNQTHWPAQWKNHPKIPSDQLVPVVVEMTNTRLYSLATGGK